MSFTGKRVVVGTSATNLLAVNASARKRIIRNLNVAKVFVAGTTGFSTTTGFPILMSEELRMNDYRGILYCRVTSGTAQVDVIEEDL